MAEIDHLLGPRAELFRRHYDVSRHGNWEGHTILNRSAAPILAAPEIEDELAACRAVLFHARAERVRPGLDDKVLADWNGLMIAALANAAAIFDRPDWLALATDAYRFVTTRMRNDDGRLAHAWRAGKRNHPATVDDYANLARAALVLREAGGDDAFLADAEGLVAILDRHHADPSGGGYFFAAA
jgi:uncharacterized protein YyaL (SSP411 family)